VANLPQVSNVPQISSKWKAALDPVLANLLINGQLLSSVTLQNGTTAVNHKLGRLPQGWFVVSPQGPSGNVYQASQQPNPTLTLSLVNNAVLITDLWVF
jgi:hypothetical protein